MDKVILDIKQKLHSNSIFDRVEASEKLAGTVFEEIILKPLNANWLRYWFGSANAWVVYIGSSPGVSGEEKNISYPSYIGVNSHLQYFNDKNNFWKTIREYTMVMFSETPVLVKKNWLKLVLAGNIVSKQAGNSKEILHLLDDRNINATIEILKQVRPKLIICLETAVQKKLRNAFLSEGFNDLKPELIEQVWSGIKKPTYYKVSTYNLYSQKDDWIFLLTKTPMHPSRRSLCNQENIKSFLKNKLHCSLLLDKLS